MELNIRHTSVFTKNLQAFENDNKRYIINCGSSRSSKSVSIIQLLIYKCLTTPNISISVIRKTFPSLRATVLRDFKDMMETLGIWNENSLNKTEYIYKFANGSYIEFFSVDDSFKIRGRKRDIVFINESNEFELEEFVQVDLRTTSKVIMDYNPSDVEIWIDDYIKKETSEYIHSTYKDNTFLQQSIVDTIESLIEVDENYYRIYALGEKSISNNRIYTHIKSYNIEPKKDDILKTIYGLDFGYVHATCLVEVIITKNYEYYIKQLIYKTGLTTAALIKEVKSLSLSSVIYADSARPDTIKEMCDNGINVKSSAKDVRDGIDYIKSKKVYIHYESIDLLKEVKSYSWKTRGETILEEVVKIQDEGVDSFRYAIYTDYKRPSSDTFDFYVYGK